jgi:hypothetical protein
MDRVDWSDGYDMKKTNERLHQYINALKAADARHYAALFQITGLDQ